MMYRHALRRLLVLVLFGSLLAAVASKPDVTQVRAANGPAHLVKDINTTQITDKTQLSSFTAVGNLLFFLAVDPINGQNLWRSDGTTAGTYVLTHNQNPRATPIGSLIAVGNTLLFMVSLDDEPGSKKPFELWTSDGSVNGTVRMGQFTGCGYLAVVGTSFFFDADDGTTGCELWKSDGTAAGTMRVADVLAGAADSNPTMVTAIGSLLFFTANDGAGGYALWRTDGTAAGTLRLTSLHAKGLATTVIQNTLFFTVDDGTSNPSLWKSDGTVAGTMSVASFQIPSDGAGPSALTAVNNTLFFVIGNEIHGTALWKSDGTTAGTVKVADVHAPYIGAGPARLCAVGSTLFFVADDGSTGVELWKSNGTAVGTGLVKNIDPGYSENDNYSSDPSNLAAVDNTLFFTAMTNGYTTPGLWRSDGTAAGTTLVKNGENTDLFVFKHKLYFVAPDAASGNYGTIYRLWSVNAQGGPSLVSTTAELRGRTIQAVGDTLFFTGGSSAESQGGLYDAPELWKTDGTSGGTARVKTFAQKSSYPTDMAAFKNKLFFDAYASARNSGLWQSDGTSANTILVKGSATYGLGAPRDLTVANNTLFFASDGSTDEYLWKSDGTVQGTTVLTDAYTSWRPLKLTPANNKLFFLSWYGSMLWVSDGTVKGTQPLSKSSPSDELVAVGNSVFFLGSSYTIWRSDGTAAGTTQVVDFENQSGYPRSLTAVGTNVFFTLYRPELGIDLWKTDGTAAGTVRVATGDEGNLIAAGNTLFFIRSVTNGFELWKSDGTMAGTVRVTDTPFAYEDPREPDVAPLMAVGDSVFFAAYDPTNGRELWKSDGTAAGTVRVKDINPGPGSSAPTNMTNIDGRLLFSAYDPEHGYELWQSNGTEAGTTLVQDINSGFGNSNPQGFTVVGDQVFFQAFTSDAGAELWEMPLSALITPTIPSSVTPTSAATSTSTPTSMATATGMPTSATTAPSTSTPLPTGATTTQTSVPTPSARMSPVPTAVSATVISTATSAAMPSLTATISAVVPTSTSPADPATVLPTLVPSATSSPVSSSATPTSAPSSIEPAGGTVTSPDGSVTLGFPAGAVPNDATVTFTALTLPVRGLTRGLAAIRSFALNATARDGTPITQFAQPYTLTITYTDAELAAVGVRANTLNLAYWNGTAWVQVLPCAGCSLDTAHHRITVQLGHFTDFAVLGDTGHTVYLPLATR